MSRKSIRRHGATVLALAVFGACVQATGSASGVVLPQNAVMMFRCEPDEALIVENGTSYPVRVMGIDYATNGFAGNTELLKLVAKNKVDTIQRISPRFRRVKFDLEPPGAPDGTTPDLRALHARCVIRSPYTGFPALDRGASQRNNPDRQRAWITPEPPDR